MFQRALRTRLADVYCINSAERFSSSLNFTSGLLYYEVIDFLACRRKVCQAKALRSLLSQARYYYIGGSIEICSLRLVNQIFMSTALPKRDMRRKYPSSLPTLTCIVPVSEPSVTANS